MVIGGGFYGCAIALHLRTRGLSKVGIVERASGLLTRASYANQARIHNGYHYPRSFVTAYRSHCSFQRFCEDYPFAVYSDFVQLYAISKVRSATTPRQYTRFLRAAGIPYEDAPAKYLDLFSPRLVESVFVTQESAFDATRLASHFRQRLRECGIRVALGTQAIALRPRVGASELVTESSASHARSSWFADVIINCTYSGVNAVARSAATQGAVSLKHELAEIVLVDPPQKMTGIGVTIMDGPFFSCMPFPAESCHSLSHVRYTPQGCYIDRGDGGDPYRQLGGDCAKSRAAFMLADARRYLPCMEEATVRRSLFEVKTLLSSTETSDGRPILFRREGNLGSVYSVLGGKIDNIYDILAKLDEVLFSQQGVRAKSAND